MAASPSVSASPVPAPTLETLPPALAHAIFEFAARTRRSHTLAPRTSELRTFAQVSKAWHELARDVASARTLRRFVVEADESVRFTCCRSGMLELRRRAVLRRAFAREFELSSHLFANMPFWLSIDEWHAIFSAMPWLEVLDFTRLPRDDVRRFEVLMFGASHSCRNLRVLRLPVAPQLPEIYFESSQFHPEHPHDTAYLADAVVTTLEAWHANGVRLRELCVPLDFTGFGERQHAGSMPYVRDLATLCPNIEVISGYEELYQCSHQQWVNSEQWFIDEAMWEKFCAGCSQLRSFDWVVVPFATRFFEIFGRHTKPRLEQLTLSTPMNWNWPRYWASLGLPVNAKGYGPTAQNAHAVLQACPNLKALVVPLYSAGDTLEPESEPELELIFDDIALSTPGGERPRRRDRVVASTEMMDQEIFGDTFCDALARHCPKLESLSIFKVVRTPDGGDAPRPIHSFTDSGLRSLATLLRLVTLELPCVNVSANGVMALLSTRAPPTEESRRQRWLKLTVEGFYRVLDAFLWLLASAREALPHQRFVLTVRNEQLQVEDPIWAATYLATLRRLVRRVLQKHTSMRLRIVVLGYAVASFACIQEFSFFSNDAELDSDDEIDDDEDVERIDDVFVALR